MLSHNCDMVVLQLKTFSLVLYCFCHLFTSTHFVHGVTFLICPSGSINAKVRLKPVCFSFRKCSLSSALFFPVDLFFQFSEILYVLTSNIGVIFTRISGYLFLVIPLLILYDIRVWSS